jgi:HlyD family secretion protein
MVAMLFSFIVWASFSQLDRVVIAHGRLVTPLPNIAVQPLETSIIKTIDVKVGQIVRKGDRLATLDPTFTEADQAQLRTQLRSLDTQRTRLQAEILGKAPLSNKDQLKLGVAPLDTDAQLQDLLANERLGNFRAQRVKLEETIAKTRAALDTNRKDQEILSTRVKSLTEMEIMQEKLVEQNYSSRARLLEAQDKRLEVEREMQLTKNRERELLRELAAVQAEKAAFDRSWRQKTMEDMLSTSRDRDALSEQLRKADKRQKLVTLTAPADAVVLDISKISQGSIVREAEPLFTLVPITDQLESEVQIDSLDVGYVKLGDKVHVKLDAFPFQLHGSLHGDVTTISEDAFRRDASAGGGSGGGGSAIAPPGMEAYYTSRIKLSAQRVKHMPDKARLLPGMTLTAEIVVGKRSVISYLLWPLTKATNESLREP